MTKGSKRFFWYVTKVRFQCWERMLYIQNIYISASFLYLNIYSGLPWKAVGGGGCVGYGGMLYPLWYLRPVSDLFEILLGNFPNYRSVDQPRFIQQAVPIIFLLALSILWQCKGILSSKQNHKLKHTKAASTKSLCQIKFIFSTPPQLFCYKYATA